MSYFEDVYKKRVNRFGTDYQSRIQGERAYAFEDYLHKSVYTTSFVYEEQTHDCVLEPYKQDRTETLHSLLTRLDLHIAAGTILLINGHHWLTYWKDENEASGYNKYIMLKADSNITWIDKDKNTYSTYGYLYGPQSASIRDALKSGTGNVIYNENQKDYYFITQLNKHINKDNYFKVDTKDSLNNIISQGYRVTGYDILSTPGVEYVTVDPMYLADTSPVPEQTTEPDEDFFWIKSGEYNQKQR